MKKITRTATLLLGILALGAGCGRTTSTQPAQAGLAPPATGAAPVQRHVLATLDGIADIRATLPLKISAADAATMLVSLANITVQNAPATFSVQATRDDDRNKIRSNSNDAMRDHDRNNIRANNDHGDRDQSRRSGEFGSVGGFGGFGGGLLGGLYGSSYYNPYLYSSGYYGGLGLYGGLGSILSGYVPGSAFNYSNYSYYPTGNYYVPYTNSNGNYYPYEYTPTYTDTYASSYDPFLYRRNSVLSPYYYRNIATLAAIQATQNMVNNIDTTTSVAR